ncbi:hypothetical protein [Paraburkholderia phosphatilytica]|uniref:hypothetical protein n=1 Tax=Paraburkholderia phosphatilytica TaxID=2282883 RepID=UPI000E47C9D5|nr:hypothetical protein [Paraburkholderia phosphatilytica]
MNLQEQIGALDVGVDQLIRTVEVLALRPAPDAAAQPADDAVAGTGASPDNAAPEQHDQHAPQAEQADAEANAAAQEKPALRLARPSQNEITMTIGDQTVSLNTLQIGQLIEELANARASMTPEPPPNLPQGWRFVSTKNPMMAVQKQSNGDRLLVMRHTGHGWVPFTFSPDIAVQLHLLLTQG